jgi:competence protein ComEA
VLDLNEADATQLEELPGVGPVTAGAIVAWRTEHGRFGTIEELQEVDGIGPKTYARIAPHVRV